MQGLGSSRCSGRRAWSVACVAASVCLALPGGHAQNVTPSTQPAFITTATTAAPRAATRTAWPERTAVRVIVNDPDQEPEEKWDWRVVLAVTLCILAAALVCCIVSLCLAKKRADQSRVAPKNMMMRGVQACIMPSDHIEQFLEANKKESQIHHARQLSGSPPQQQAGQQTKGMFKGAMSPHQQNVMRNQLNHSTASTEQWSEDGGSEYGASPMRAPGSVPPSYGKRPRQASPPQHQQGPWGLHPANMPTMEGANGSPATLPALHENGPQVRQAPPSTSTHRRALLNAANAHANAASAQREHGPALINNAYGSAPNTPNTGPVYEMAGQSRA